MFLMHCRMAIPFVHIWCETTMAPAPCKGDSRHPILWMVHLLFDRAPTAKGKSHCIHVRGGKCRWAQTSPTKCCTSALFVGSIEIQRETLTPQFVFKWQPQPRPESIEAPLLRCAGDSDPMGPRSHKCSVTTAPSAAGRTHKRCPNWALLPHGM